jgi:hypothetical protein
MNTQELARELGHPEAQKLLSGSLSGRDESARTFGEVGAVGAYLDRAAVGAVL